GVFPSPACGGGTGRGHAKREGACKKTHACKLTPSPPLPRKREREQTEFAAGVDSTRAHRAHYPRTISDMLLRPRASARLAGCFATRALTCGNQRRTITSPSPLTHAATTSSVSSQVR